MILRSLHARHWRGLPEVTLNDLPAGLTIISGPNRTGKTSLAEALRCTLVDWHYDTASSRAVVPWGTAAVPAVTLELEIGGTRYLLEKRFSKRKEGGAALFRLDDAGGREVLAEGKEATTRTQQLLGLEKSSGGLAQVLWVQQGVVDLPAIDQDLGNTLRRLLGSIITGQDERFHERLWKRMEPWFTNEANAAQGKHRRNSPVADLRAAVGAAQAEVTRIADEFARIDHLLEEVARLQAAQSEAEAEAHRCEAEVTRLETAEAAVAEKRRAFEKAEAAAQQLRRDLDRLSADARRHAEYADAVRQADAQAAAKQAGLPPLEQALLAATLARGTATAARQQADEAQETLAQQSRQFGVMRELLDLQTRQTALTDRAARVRELQAEVAALEHDLSAQPAPSPKELARVQALNQRLDQIEAELNAGQLTITVEAKRPTSVTFTPDHAAADPGELTAGEIQRWQVRQRGRLVLGDIAEVEVTRGTEDAALEQLASDQATLSAELADLLSQWGLTLADRGKANAELSARTATRAQTEAKLDGLRQQLAREAPKGLPALETELAKLEGSRARLLSEHPECAQGECTPAALAQSESALRDETAAVQARLRTARTQDATAETALTQARQSLDAARAELTKLEATRTESRTRLEELVARYGSEAALAEAVRTHEAKLAEAQADLERHRLTEEELSLPGQVLAARAARDDGRTRHRDLQLELAGIQGQLRQTEGLHALRCSAEQTLNARQRELARADLEVEAHALLLALFAQSRDESVGSAIGPVADRVVGWLSKLYAGTPPRLDFGPDLSVSGLTVPEGPSLDVDEATSYGEREQLSLLVRLAYGAELAKDEPQTVLLDDPLAHADDAQHARMLEILQEATQHHLQLLLLTCHPERFATLEGAARYELGAEGVEPPMDADGE